MENREFRLVPEGEQLVPSKKYYADSWRALSDEILEAHGKELLHMSKMYKDGEVVDVDLVLLEEYPPGKAPGNIKHSFYVAENLLFTYVF